MEGKIGVNCVRNPSKGWHYLQAANFACVGRHKNRRWFRLQREQAFPSETRICSSSDSLRSGFTSSRMTHDKFDTNETFSVGFYFLIVQKVSGSRPEVVGEPHTGLLDWLRAL